MEAISVAQACRVAEAFMGFLSSSSGMECYFSGSGSELFHGISFLLRNVMSAISVAQARRVAELAFMDFYSSSSGMSECFSWDFFHGISFFLLRNVMKCYFSGSGAQSRWTSFHGISILPSQECHECYFSGSGAQSRWTSFHGNVMSAMAQARRVAELAFMGYLGMSWALFQWLRRTESLN